MLTWCIYVSSLKGGWSNTSLALLSSSLNNLVSVSIVYVTLRRMDSEIIRGISDKYFLIVAVSKITLKPILAYYPVMPSIVSLNSLILDQVSL